MARIQKREYKKVTALRALFPREITVRVHRSEDGGFWVEILRFPGCVTQGDTFSELIEMINDALRTYFEVPSKYLPFMPTYLPSIGTAQRFDAFPRSRATGNLKLNTIAAS